MKMAPSARTHRRSHSLLLLNRLLNLRDGASPLTVVLDSLQQNAGPLLDEFIQRAKAAGSKVVLVSFATVQKPKNVHVFVKGRGKSLEALRSEIATHCPPPTVARALATNVLPSNILLIIDSLNPCASSYPHLLSAFLSAIITSSVSLVAVYHTDVPLVLPKTYSQYEPHPQTMLCHLATAILRVSSLYQAVQARKARNRSLPEPAWGLDEVREGVLFGLKKDEHEAEEGLVIGMEMRRRSGRSLSEEFIMMLPRLNRAPPISLLSDHVLFAPAPNAAGDAARQGSAAHEMDATFDLGLTEKQRRDRAGVVLPYFDAQTDIGTGEGGRILYEIGREDDFDEEEDEI